jgi:hypothetical protein
VKYWARSSGPALRQALTEGRRASADETKPAGIGHTRGHGEPKTVRR